MGFDQGLRFSSNLSVIIPIIVWLLAKGDRSRLINLVFLLLGLSAVTDLITFVSHLSARQNAIMFNAQDVLQFFLIAFLYYELYLKEFRYALYSIIGIYGAFEIINSVIFQGFGNFQNLSWTFTGIIFTILAIGWKLHTFVTTPVLRMTAFANFWFNTAILIYFSVNLFLFILTDFVFTQLNESQMRVFWSFHNFNNILKNILFAVGMYYSQPEIILKNKFET